MLQGSSLETHYTRLYSCKHFRNRVIRLQQLCLKLNTDALLLVIGMDSLHDEEMKKLQNWLLYGMSASDINGSALSDAFADSFIVISKDSFQAYTNSQGFKELSNLTTLLTNCNLYTITKSDEEDSEKQEVIKVAKFYEMLHDKQSLGMPLRRLTNNDYVSSELQMVEKWPIIQAYGLDMVGGGFFTMKHHIVNVRDELDKIYAEYDSFAIYRIVYDEIDRFNQHFYDNFFTFNKDTPLKRLERTEQDLIDSFWLRYEFSLLSKKAGHTEVIDDGLPLPRALIGRNTNKTYEQLSNKDDRLYKYNLVDGKDSALHFTFDFVEKNTNIRFARTYFLSNLSQHYMQGYSLSEDEEQTKPNAFGRINELNTKILFNAYVALLLTFNNISEQVLKQQMTVQEAQSAAFAQFSKIFTSRNGQEMSDLLKKGKENFILDIKAFDTFGNVVDIHNNLQKKLIIIRMQVKHIMSPHEEQTDLGSIVYGDTFFYIDNDTFINTSKNVPNLQFWYTTNKHYEHLPIQVQTEKNMNIQRLGQRVNYYTDLQGLVPIKNTLNEVLNDIILMGKLVFYEKGFIFVDNRLNAFVLSYDDIEYIYFYQADQQWIEIKTKQQHSLPANMIIGDTIYIKVNQQFINDKFKLLQTTMETSFPETKIEKKYTQCPYVFDSLTYKNFEVNKKHNKTISCDYLNFSFVEPDYKELLEFHTLGEFNSIRGKEFIPFEPFHKIYQDSQKQVPYGNYTQMFVEKLKQQNINNQNQHKINLIVISGIPGSGKTKTAQYLQKQLQNENLSTGVFKMQHVQDTVKFSTPKFIQQMLQQYDTLKQQKVVITVLPSYNHLKKVIFELKKSQEFNEMFDIKYIITKVHARNFYMNKNRNTYQFLIENCMKGVTQAIIFEKSNVNINELQIMQRCLENANFEQNILPTQGRTFKLEDIAKILVNNHEKLNILYNKYFYGFEKEGKSQYFQEKQVQGTYINYRYPFREDLLQQTIMMALNTPINNADNLIPKTEFEKESEANKENEIKKQMETMTKEEQRKYERELKKQKKIEADLEPERLLKEEMDIVKRRVGGNDLYIERIRGYVLVEGKEDEQDYELVCNFNELSLRPLKNQGKRLQPEELGVIVYGRNLNEQLIKEVLKTGRTQLTKKKHLRTRDNITKEEIEMLKDKHVSDMLPEKWFYNGYLYFDIDGKSQDVHPNLEGIIKNYIDEQNGMIGDHNREVQKEWKNDIKKYE